MSNSYKKHYAESGKAGKRKKHKRIYNKKIRNLKDEDTIKDSLIKKHTDTIKEDLDYLCSGGFYCNPDKEAWLSKKDRFSDIESLKEKIDGFKSRKIKITQENINNIFFQVKDKGYSSIISTNYVVYEHLEKNSPAKNLIIFDKCELAKRFHMFLNEAVIKEAINKHNSTMQDRIEECYKFMRLRKQAEKESNKKFELHKLFLAK